jgi:hypothetical protein
MSEAVIGHELEEENARLASVTTGPFPGDQAGRMPHGYPEYQAEQRMPSDSRAAGTSYLSDILDAQQQLISAQHQYLHDNDPAKLLRAQLNVIGVYNGVLDRLGVYG